MSPVSFTFKVVIDVLIAILLIVVVVFCSSSFFLSSFALFACDLMSIFSVMFGFLSLFLCIYYRFLVCAYHEVYI